MDAAHKSGRKFPAYTLAELKASVARHKVNNPALAIEIEREIERREAGLSVAFKVPQL